MVISFSNQKGGVGKTTSCVNLAASLALYGKRILLVDFDPQANATSALGLFDKKAKNGVYDVLCDKCDASAAIRKSEVEGLDFIPSSSDLAGAELELSRIVVGRERVLKERLDDVKENYDMVFIDCPPSLGLLPIQCEFFALEGLSQMMNTVKLVKTYCNPSISIVGVILTMYDGRSKLSRGVLEEIKKFFGDKVFDVKIPRNVRLAEAPSHGKPIALHDPRCMGARAYAALTEEFLKKTEGGE